MIKKFFVWLVASSTDANKISLTVKGALTAILPIVIAVSGIANLPISEGDASAAISAISAFIQSVLSGIAAIMFIAGFVRKLYRSILERNDTTTAYNAKN